MTSSARNATEKFSFTWLTEHKKAVKLPSTNWICSGNDKCLRFRQITRTCEFRKRVTVHSNLRVTVYLGGVTFPLTKYIKIECVKELINLLKDVNNLTL